MCAGKTFRPDLPFDHLNWWSVGGNSLDTQYSYFWPLYQDLPWPDPLFRLTAFMPRYWGEVENCLRRKGQEVKIFHINDSIRNLLDQGVITLTYQSPRASRAHLTRKAREEIFEFCLEQEAHQRKGLQLVTQTFSWLDITNVAGSWRYDLDQPLGAVMELLLQLHMRESTVYGWGPETDEERAFAPFLESYSYLGAEGKRVSMAAWERAAQVLDDNADLIRDLALPGKVLPAYPTKIEPSPWIDEDYHSALKRGGISFRPWLR